MDSLFYLVHALSESPGCFLQRLRVDAHSVHLHFGEHRHQRHLYVAEQIVGAALLQFRFQLVLQLQCDVRILGGIFIHLAWLQIAHALLAFSFRTDKFLYANRLVVEIRLRHVVHVVSRFRLDEIVGNHGVKHLASHLHTIVGEYLDVVFHVLSDFENFFVFVERFKYINYFFCFFTIA